MYFYPRSPRGERPKATDRQVTGKSFLSTLPAWGATLRKDDSHGKRIISIHAPRVGSDPMPDLAWSVYQSISIHAPRVGSDPCQFAFVDCICISIHAPRVGSDKRTPVKDVVGFGISIHAPRVGSDVSPPRPCSRVAEFLSTLPAWGATCVRGTSSSRGTFLSTLPAWGATCVVLP